MIFLKPAQCLNLESRRHFHDLGKRLENSVLLLHILWNTWLNLSFYWLCVIIISFSFLTATPLESTKTSAAPRGRRLLRWRGFDIFSLAGLRNRSTSVFVYRRRLHLVSWWNVRVFSADSTRCFCGSDHMRKGKLLHLKHFTHFMERCVFLWDATFSSAAEYSLRFWFGGFCLSDGDEEEQFPVPESESVCERLRGKSLTRIQNKS